MYLCSSSYLFVSLLILINSSDVANAVLWVINDCTRPDQSVAGRFTFNSSQIVHLMQYQDFKLPMATAISLLALSIPTIELYSKFGALERWIWIQIAGSEHLCWQWTLKYMSSSGYRAIAFIIWYLSSSGYIPPLSLTSNIRKIQLDCIGNLYYSYNTLI